MTPEQETACRFAEWIMREIHWKRLFYEHDEYDRYDGKVYYKEEPKEKYGKLWFTTAELFEIFEKENR